MSAGSLDRPRSGWADVAMAVLIFVATVAYLAALPRFLNPADESVHLYEAKRILGGAVLYRDVFNFITPGWFYLMAALFWLFGTDMATARIAIAVVHGLTAVLAYLTCRRLRIRMTLAWLPALAYLVIAQPAWPIASQHWVTTLLTAAVLYICARRRRDRARWGLWAGGALGLLVGVQQQRGAFIALGVIVWLVSEAALERRDRIDPPPVRLPIVLVYLAAGTLLTLAPLLAPSVVFAGVERMWYALITFPLFSYHEKIHFPWGSVNIMTAWYARSTLPAVLKYMPVVLLVSVPRLVLLWWQRRDPPAAERLLLLVVFCAASTLSMAYSPDFIHLAFIAPTFFITGTEAIEWALQQLTPRGGLPRIAAVPIAAAILGLSGWRLANNRARWESDFPISHATGFGRVDFATADEVQLYETVNDLLARTPSRALYVYPILSDLYLTARADNPTPYGFFSAIGYNTPAQVQEVLAILAAKRLPYVVAFAPLLNSNDPIMHYLTAAYEPVTATPLAGRAILRRKDDAPAGRTGER